MNTAVNTLVPNREAWLELAITKLRVDLFKHHGFILPETRVSVGFPGGKRAKNVIGQHWHPMASEDMVSQIFISPIHRTSIDCLETLVHELVHACVPDAKHGKAFRKIAVKVGLEGKMRATTAGETLIGCLNTLISEIGEIPHATISYSDPTVKKQTIRMLKVECLECGYVCRTANKWIDLFGPPICPCNETPMLVKL